MLFPGAGAIDKILAPLLAQFGPRILAELKPWMARVIPPPDSDPIYWAGRFTVAAGAVETAGVLWEPSNDSTGPTGNASNSFRLSADTPEVRTNEALARAGQFPPGFRGVAWFAIDAAQTANAAAVANLQTQMVWSVSHNGQDLPGFSRQHVGGSSHREVAAANTVNSWQVSSVTPCPIDLRQGDTAAVEIDNSFVGSFSTDVLVRCYGWRWQE